MGTTPVAFWRLGDPIGSTSVIDSSGNNYTGSLINGAAGLPSFGGAGFILYDPSTCLDCSSGANIPSGAFTTANNLTGPPTQNNPLASAGTAWAVEMWINYTGGNSYIPTLLPATPAQAAAGTGFAPTGGLPASVGGGYNQFVWTPVATLVPETFTVADGDYSTLSALATAVGAATGSTSGEPFSTYVTVSNNGTGLVLTSVATGPQHNGDAVSAGPFPHDISDTLGIQGLFLSGGANAANNSKTVANGVIATWKDSAGISYQLQVGITTKLSPGGSWVPATANTLVVAASKDFIAVEVTGIESSTNLNILDGNWHQIAMTTASVGSVPLTSFYIDGALIGDNLAIATSASAMADPVDFTFGGIAEASSGLRLPGMPYDATNFAGKMQYVSLWNTTLTATQVAGHYAVANWFQSIEPGAGQGDTTAGRLNKVLAVAGLPSNILVSPYPWKTLLYAETNPVTTTSALNYIQTTTETEPGLIYQGPDGYIYALNRQYQYLNSTSTTSQGEFGDAASVQYHYNGPALQIVQDDLDLFNDIQVQSGRGAGTGFSSTTNISQISGGGTTTSGSVASSGGVGIYWDFNGPLVLTNSDIYVAGDALQFTKLTAMLTVSGTSNVTFTLNHNGSAFESFTVPYNSLPYSTTLSGALSVAVADTLQVAITGAGTAASGLVIVLS